MVAACCRRNNGVFRPRKLITPQRSRSDHTLLKLKPDFGGSRTHRWWEGAYDADRTHAAVVVWIGTEEQNAAL